MRICLVGTGVQPIPPTGYGGVERTLAEFGRALEAAGHTVVIINEVRHGRSRDEYAFARGLVRKLGPGPFDVVHASTPVVANRLAWGGVPFVYTTHSRHWFQAERWSERWGAWLERRAVRRAAATVALTDRLARQIQDVCGTHGPRRMTVIPIGVDLDRFAPDWAARTGRRALGVGVVLPMKRWELAAAALRGTNVSLTIVGPTPDPEYAARVRAAGDQVTLLGEIDDPALTRLYAESDLLIHPSRVELLAGVVLQGLAAGLPVLGAEPIAGLVDDGVTGFLAPASADADGVTRSLAAAVRTLQDDPVRRRTMGAAARKVAAERFGWPAVVAAHTALYESLIAEGALSRRRSPSP